MKLSEAGELSLLEIVRRRFTRSRSRLVLGIGDDSAVIRPRNTNMLITSDMMVEGVHFDLSWTTPYQIGFKLISVNVSDIYAMCGKPEFVTLNFAAREDTAVTFFKRLLDGVRDALKHYNAALIGGDIVRSDRITLSATMTGYASSFLKRSGARVGDKIYVTGYLGDASGGLELIKKINKPVEIEKGKKVKLPLSWNVVLPLITRHLMPRAKKPRGLLHKATSMIDISDGLFMDTYRMCRESGVGAKIYSSLIPLSPELRKTAEYLQVPPLNLAMGGEDYELLFTARKKEKIDAFCIGEVIKSGMKIVDEKGRISRLSIKGYEHFKIQGEV
jgi:thiamine-monophosphate kinase